MNYLWFLLELQHHKIWQRLDREFTCKQRTIRVVARSLGYNWKRKRFPDRWQSCFEPPVLAVGGIVPSKLCAFPYDPAWRRIQLRCYEVYEFSCKCLVDQTAWKCCCAERNLQILVGLGSRIKDQWRQMQKGNPYTGGTSFHQRAVRVRCLPQNSI